MAIKGEVPNWERDDIQFPRLLAELDAVLTIGQLRTVAASMDLSVTEILELIDRARFAWEEIVKETCPVDFGGTDGK